MKSHPSQRFRAPTSIQTGVPLKELLGRDLVRLIAESMSAVVPDFNTRRFQREALDELDELEFSPRGIHIARAMAAQLPEDFDDAAPLLISMLGPELPATDGNGLAPFFYLPHAHVISLRGTDRFESGMLANYELTKRMTAEFSIRPFLVAHRSRCLELLHGWTQDSNPHVRRLVSEGTRPRLPWAMRLKEFQQTPQFTLPLLELLKDDPELYVRRSVANHLADILKDHPAVAYSVCERWLEEANATDPTSKSADNRRWIIRHAVRLPAKQGDRRATLLREAAR